MTDEKILQLFKDSLKGYTKVTPLTLEKMGRIKNEFCPELDSFSIDKYSFHVIIHLLDRVNELETQLETLLRKKKKLLESSK